MRALQYENKEYVLDTPIPKIDIETNTLEEITSNAKNVDNATKVAYIMITTMAPDLQKSY